MREITWHSPKHYQKGYDSVSSSNPAKLPKPRSKYCKFLKGPHQYGEWKPEVHSWEKEKINGFWVKFCIRCNKKETWLAPSLPDPCWELDKSARPPGFMEG